MRALSVRQPWAWALIHGGKDVENRNWQTKYRGPLAIHAGKAFDFTLAQMRQGLRGEYGETIKKLLLDYRGNDVRGAIIGTVELYDCIPSWKCDSKWKAGPDPDYFCWLVREPIPLEQPILLKGQLGLFDVPDSFFRRAS
jgi:hypothetical protein